MKLKVISIVIILSFSSVLTCQHLLAQDTEKAEGSKAGLTSASIKTNESSEGTISKIFYNRTTLGCAGGALLGSIIPGFGNVAGCAIGGLIGWIISPTTETAK